jgi:hypothetical protein
VPQTQLKDPDAVLDYAFDWTAWLAAGETVTDAAVTIGGPDAVLTIAAGKPAPAAGSVVTVWLAGGTIGNDYGVVAHITTSAGREDDRTITIKVRQR